MKSFPEKFVEHFKALYEEYKYVKKAIILAENLDPEKKILIAPLNQLRSALDHAFKATVIDNEEQIGHELNEFREHVRRAGYDAFELLSSIIGLTIVDKVKRYSNKTITNVFPDYYSSIRPLLIQMQSDMAEIRSDKNNYNQPFLNYITKLNLLIDSLKRIDSMLPGLEEFEQKEKRESLKKIAVQFFSAVMIAIISAYCGFLIGNHNTMSKTNENHEIVSDSIPTVVDSTDIKE
ncbi:MAG: hypothetical protein PF487_05650 [Bacteroidales bacterium]|jgi:hypothetical protein|nr:hypothetical protein [Bacteroidales bacterium]